MSSSRKQEWPTAGDLVMATVEQVTDYGAYVNLDEYGKRGLLHISEISSSWIRNIRDFVREGQKVVLKVLRVDMEKNHIDLSLRRVTRRERIEKVMAWKKERKAEALLKNVAEKTGLSIDEINAKVATPMEAEYGLYEGFEKTVREGIEVLTKLGISEDIATVVNQVATERIRVPMVEVRGTVDLRVMKPDGVRIIKEAFGNARKSEKSKDAKLRFYVIAAPRYSVEVMADNYKHGEEVLQQVTDNIVSFIKKAGGEASFKREK